MITHMTVILLLNLVIKILEFYCALNFIFLVIHFYPIFYKSIDLTEKIFKKLNFYHTIRVFSLHPKI